MNLAPFWALQLYSYNMTSTAEKAKSRKLSVSIYRMFRRVSHWVVRSRCSAGPSAHTSEPHENIKPVVNAEASPH